MGVSKDFKTLNPLEILDILPHRYPFLFVDRVDGVEVSKTSPIGDRIWGTKAVSYGESFFQGHFPDRPVMPGVLSIEAISQMASFLIWRHIQYSNETDLFYLASVDKAKFRQPIEPGVLLKIEVVLKNVKQHKFWSVEGKIFSKKSHQSEEELVAEASVTAVVMKKGKNK